MGAEVIILANPYTYNFLRGLTHSDWLIFEIAILHTMQYTGAKQTSYHCKREFK